MLDEPSLGLAPMVVEQLATTIPLIAREWHTTVLLSEQFVQLVVAVANRVYVLSHGEVVKSGPPDMSTLGADILSGYLGEVDA
jgi:branched-chain amino acid transport system ATP-binding protein